ncbi:hypothetical protein FQN50_001716 [Emmonsiellopsis sp. PD_5]|nr:hypothetical protein FQN50_001716 [Emmonsiellopsis sp. PD_5]
MQPNHLEPPGPVRDGVQERRLHITRDNTGASRDRVMSSRNASGGPHTRSEDSWIEVASQPSSSSLSSATTNEDIVTTGLQIRHQRQRRLSRRHAASHNINIDYSHRSPSAPGSSQDEYEESESEPDHVLSSSNEDMSRSRGNALFIHGHSSASEPMLSSDDEDDNSTALGLNSNLHAFTPQPNAFSHPPTSQNQRSRATDFAPNPTRPPLVRTGSRRNSRSSLRSARHSRQQQHSPYNMISPSYQADNDAALRASLSTLLSCAAAARGLPKNDTQPQRTERAEPSAFRLVPESVALGNGNAQECNRGTNAATAQSKPPRSSSSKRSTSPTTGHKTRRKASPSRAHSPSKRSRRVDNMSQSASIVSPTVMTWVISAGVVVLFSAISFSAGYVLGREVGHTEAAQGLGGNGLGGLLNQSSSSGEGGLAGIKAGAGCGKEAVKGGLRRFRWVGGGAGSSISA